MHIEVGQYRQLDRLVTQADFDRFAALSGDDNPIHVDPAFAALTKFGRTVAHGMFLYSLVNSVLGTELPGPGTRQLEQELMFPTPTYCGEEVAIRVEVAAVWPADGVAEMSTTVTGPGGHVGLQGRTLVRLPGSDAAKAWSAPATEAVASGGAGFKGLAVGQRAAIGRAFTAAELAEYAALVGDANPLWTDAAYARQIGLPGPLVPGSLLGGLFSYLLGTRLPGRGTNYLKQRLHFPAAACVDQELTAVVEIVRLRPEKELVNLSTTCTDPAGETVCRGEALVWASDVEDG